MIHYSVAPARAQAAVVGRPFHRYVFEDGSIWTEFYRLGTNYLLRFPDLADFEVSGDGETVTAYPTDDTDETTIEHLYINQLVPLALSRQGKPAFHASVVTVPGGAIAFLGKTGMGKSTLAASFAFDDATFLTDDALIIEERDSTCLALPSSASIRLWEDSVDALVGDDGELAIAVSYSSKARLLAGDALAYSSQPTELIAAYVLDRKEPGTVSIDVLSGSGRHMAWVQNSFLLDIQDKDLLARHFDWTHRISSNVPTFSLDFQRDYGILPEVRRIIREHAGSLL